MQYAFTVTIYTFVLDNMEVCMWTKPFLRIHLSNVISIWLLMYSVFLWQVASAGWSVMSR